MQIGSITDAVCKWDCNIDLFSVDLLISLWMNIDFFQKITTKYNQLYATLQKSGVHYVVKTRDAAWSTKGLYANVYEIFILLTTSALKSHLQRVFLSASSQISGRNQEVRESQRIIQSQLPSLACLSCS